MAVLPTLYPAAPDGTATTMAAPVGAATHAEAMQTNDGDTSYATSGVDSAGSVFVNLDDTPTDFSSMDSLTVSCVVRLNGTQTDDTTALYAQIFAADEATALTDEVFVTDHLTGSAYTVDSTALVLNATGAGADKATWDGARLRLRWAYTKSKASDGIALRVTQTYLDGAYTAAVPTVTGAAALSGTAQQTALGRGVSSGSLAITGEATTVITRPPEATAGPMQIGTLFNEEFYYGSTTTGPATVTGSATVQGTASQTAAGSVSSSGTVAVSSTASTLTVSFAEKRGTISVTGNASQSTVASASTSASTALTAVATVAVATEFLPPSDVTATATSPTSVRLEWTAVSGAEGYDIERDGVVITRVTTPYYDDTGLTKTTTYTYRVRSMKYETV